MYIFYILNVIVSPLVHTPFSVGGLLVVDLTSLNKTFSGVFFFPPNILHRRPQSVLCEQTWLSDTYHSFFKKENNPQCDVSGFTTPSDTQAGPSGPRHRLFGPVYLLVSKVPTCSW